MKLALVAIACIALHAASPIARAQSVGDTGPFVERARSAFAAPASIRDVAGVTLAIASTPCGSRWKNAAMLGLGLALATGVLEVTYTLVREPVVRNGGSWPHADPALIAWAGGVGFVVGLVGTEVCRRRNR